MFEQITTLVEMLNLLSLDYRIILREGDDPLRRLRNLREAGVEGRNDDLLFAISTLETSELFRVFAALSLQPQMLTPDQINRLHEFLLNGKDISLQTAVTRQLRLATHPIVVEKLFDALIRCSDPHLRGVIAYSIAENGTTDWKGKLDQMLIVLQRHKFYREHLDCAALVTAIRPPFDVLAQKRFLLTDHLVGKAAALSDDIVRVTGILAGLIIESVGHNLNRANQRLGEYEYEHDEAAIVLTLLRSEMNSLLTPAERQAQLEETFKGPMRETNDEIRQIWQSSIMNVEKTLRLRRQLGGSGFAAGVLILLFAVMLIGFSGTAGYLVALIGIMMLVITAVYSGPVRDYKQVLTEIGTANAAYTAYIQRTLEISNVYMNLYLHDQLTQEALTTSNELINKAMNDTINALRIEKKTTLSDLLSQLND